MLTGAWGSHGGSIAGSPEGRKHDVAALVLDAQRKETIEKAIAVLRTFIVRKSNGLDVYMVGVRDLRQLISRSGTGVTPPPGRCLRTLQTNVSVMDA